MVENLALAQSHALTQEAILQPHNIHLTTMPYMNKTCHNLTKYHTSQTFDSQPFWLDRRSGDITAQPGLLLQDADNTAVS